MGNDEAIIYGHRHGDVYKDITDGTNGAKEERVYYPNGIRVCGHSMHDDVSVGVITFDQETGQRLYSESPDDPQTYQLYAQLDRDGVNRLIRDLRKMRDRVFGADA